MSGLDRPGLSVYNGPMLSIRDLHLQVPAMLAPMAGVSDLPFRLMARKLGCPMAFAEMISAHALCLGSGRTNRFLESSSADRPLGIQLLGREPEYLRQAMDLIEPGSCDVIDLNAACPVRKVTRKGEGAALLKEPRLLSKLVALLKARASVPVTVKIRSGWDPSSVNAREIGKRVADAGADAVCVHGRTRSQGYGGRVDLGVIRSVKEAVSIPVIASGDLFSAKAVDKTLRETGCDGVAIARGALGNPWIFREIAAVYGKRPSPPRPNIEQLKEVMEEHLRLSVERRGEILGVIDFRKFFIWYTKGLQNARILRPRAVRVNTPHEMRRLIDELGMPLSSGPHPSASQGSPYDPRQGWLALSKSGWPY